MAETNNESNLVRLGFYDTEDRKRYDCFFFSKENERIAFAIGPIESGNYRGPAHDPKIEVEAQTESEAKDNIAKKLGPGCFV